MTPQLLPELYPVVVQMLAEEAECHAVEARFDLPTFGNANPARRTLLLLRLVNKQLYDAATPFAFKYHCAPQTRRDCEQTIQVCTGSTSRFLDCSDSPRMIFSQICVSSIPNLQVLCIRGFGLSVYESNCMTILKPGTSLSKLQQVSHLHCTGVILRSVCWTRYTWPFVSTHLRPIWRFSTNVGLGLLLFLLPARHSRAQDTRVYRTFASVVLAASLLPLTTITPNLQSGCCRIALYALRRCKACHWAASVSHMCYENSSL